VHKRQRDSSWWQRQQPGEEDSCWMVTNSRSEALLPVASHCPRGNRGRRCHSGHLAATDLGRHPGSRRVPTTSTLSMPVRKRVH
jgi:hypothetical protein